MTDYPIWIIEKDIFDTESRLKKSLTDLGITYKTCSYNSMGGVKFDDPNFSLPLHVSKIPPFFYGTLQLGKRIATSAVVFLNLPEFRCSYYYPKFGRYLLQQDYCMLPYGELTRRKDWLLHHLGKDGKVFVRPDDGYKSFNGQIVEADTWSKDIDLVGFYHLSAETMCVVCTPQSIKTEWRLVVGAPFDSNDQKIVAATRYMKDGENIEEEGATHDVENFVNEILNEVSYRPDPYWTIDICETDAGLHVLEVGSMSCAGLYACNLEKVAIAVSETVTKEWQEWQDV